MTKIFKTEEEINNRILHTWPLNYNGKKVAWLTPRGYIIAQKLLTLGLADIVYDISSADIIVDDVHSDTMEVVCGNVHLYWAPYTSEEFETIKFPWPTDA